MHFSKIYAFDRDIGHAIWTIQFCLIDLTRRVILFAIKFSIINENVPHSFIHSASNGPDWDKKQFQMVSLLIKMSDGVTAATFKFTKAIHFNYWLWIAGSRILLLLFILFCGLKLNLGRWICVAARPPYNYRHGSQLKTIIFGCHVMEIRSRSFRSFKQCIQPSGIRHQASSP